MRSPLHPLASALAAYRSVPIRNRLRYWGGEIRLRAGTSWFLHGLAAVSKACCVHGGTVALDFVRGNRLVSSHGDRMKKRYWFVVISVAILLILDGMLAESAAAQTANPAVYLESKDEFANDFSAGVIRKGVPVTLSADRQDAGYLVRFTWATNEGSKTQGVMTALMTGIYISGAYERVSMSILERKSKNLVYSYTCQKGGRHMQSVAECLAKQWKYALDSGQVKMRQFSAAELAGIQDSDGDTVSVRKAGDSVPTHITERPAVVAAPSLQENVISEAQNQPESVAEASRRAKAQRAAAATPPQR